MPLPPSRITPLAECLTQSPIYLAVHFSLAIAALITILAIDGKLKSDHARWVGTVWF